MLSEKILIERSGNFTSSENHRLMAGWDIPKPKEPTLICLEDEFKKMDKKPLVGFVKSEFEVDATGADVNELWAWVRWHDTPQGLITYAEEKAMETLFYQDPSLYFETVHTRNGNERELEAIEMLESATGLKFENTGKKQAHISVDEVGATPDGVVLGDDFSIVTGAEVKCKSPLVHAKNLLINNNDDLKRDAFEHYVQIQTQMLVTDTDHWHFANYNPYAKHDALMFKHIIIERDDPFIEIMAQRIETAKKIKAEFLENFNGLLAVGEK